MRDGSRHARGGLHCLAENHDSRLWTQHWMALALAHIFCRTCVGMVASLIWGPVPPKRRCTARVSGYGGDLLSLVALVADRVADDLGHDLLPGGRGSRVTAVVVASAYGDVEIV